MHPLALDGDMVVDMPMVAQAVMVMLLFQLAIMAFVLVIQILIDLLQLVAVAVVPQEVVEVDIVDYVQILFLTAWVTHCIDAFLFHVCLQLNLMVVHWNLMDHWYLFLFSKIKQLFAIIILQFSNQKQFIGYLRLFHHFSQAVILVIDNYCQ